jgi:hypothetical protein
MANPEHVALVRQREAWNKWREECPDLTPNLRTADLHKADLIKANLHRANLSGANLDEARLSGADLSGANLRSAYLRGADLHWANLIGANLSEADLRESDLSSANLIAANLSTADLTATILVETIFGDTNLQSAKGLADCRFDGPCTLDHRTIQQSGSLPLPFLRGCGLPDSLIEYLPSLLNHAIQYFSCFISYSHNDKQFARRLFDTLQGRGIRCWLDEKQMLPGDDIYEEIDRGIRIWDKVLLCCSQHSLKPASWVDKEIITALEKEDELARQRGAKVRVLVALNLDDFLFGDHWRSGYRAEIRRRLTADFTGWERDNGKFEAQLEQVIRALRSDDAARSPAPEPKL